MNPSLLFNLSDGTSLSYELELVEQEALFDRGIVAIDGDPEVLPVSRFLGDPQNGPTNGGPCPAPRLLIPWACVTVCNAIGSVNSMNSTSTTVPVFSSAATASGEAVTRSRIASIDIMRGLVILLMLVDHVRERLYLHMQVSDPMDVTSTSPGLFFTRWSAHFCAPTFIFLTGLSAWLYAHPARGGLRSPSTFLFKRGIFLLFLEMALINFSWLGSYQTLWLQVIWAIGLSMIALSLLVKLRYWIIGALGFLIVFGHNLLTPISFSPGEFGYSLWTILHDRGFLLDSETLRIKISYPVLPWIGVILLGYFAGPLYARAVDSVHRRKMLLALGLGCLALLLVLRGFNLYGETLPWVDGQTALQTLMSFVNFTKYPPSLSFLLMTLGVMFLLLAWFENRGGRMPDILETFGSVPMFFYILHLYVLLVGYEILLVIFGPNHGERFGVDHLWWIWLIAGLLSVLLYFPAQAFARFKHGTNRAWAKYL